MIKVVRKEGESGERLLKRFSSRVKSCRMQQKFRSMRYFSNPTTKRKQRLSAISREGYRAENKRKAFLT